MCLHAGTTYEQFISSMHLPSQLADVRLSTAPCILPTMPVCCLGLKMLIPSDPRISMAPTWTEPKPCALGYVDIAMSPNHF